jgi:uncharacterized DUF497 family protein
MTKRSDFEWDSSKDLINIEKHGVSFALAQLVLSWKIWSTARMKNDITALVESLMES